jgi:hypothetical protein
LSGLKDPTDLDPSGDRNWFFLTVWTKYNFPLPHPHYTRWRTLIQFPKHCVHASEKGQHHIRVRISAYILGMVLIGFSPSHKYKSVLLSCITHFSFRIDVTHVKSYIFCLKYFWWRSIVRLSCTRLRHD